MANETGLIAAAFLGQALGLADPAADILPDLDLVSEDPPVTIWAAEVGSSAGPAAFLVYVYDLSTATDREDGATRLAADREVLNRAATLDAPGPRLAAEATTDRYGLVLVTTPGFADSVPPAPTVPSRVNTRQAQRRRQEAAEALQSALKQANDRARALRELLPAADDANPEFGEAERALALFLLDDRSLADFTAVVRRLVGLDTARGKKPGSSG